MSTSTNRSLPEGAPSESRPDKHSRRVRSGAKSGITRRQALGALGALALPWDRLVGQTVAPNAATTPATGSLPPDLVNLHPLMEWISGERKLQLSYLETRWRELDAWKAVARPFFRELLRYDPTPLPLRAEAVRREDRDGFTLEAIKISATPAYHIPAWVLVPKGRGGRLPAVVAIHDHGGRYVWGQEKLISYPTDSAERAAVTW